MSDVRANSYVSPIIGKIPRMVTKAKLLYKNGAMEEFARIKNDFHKIELDVYNNREIISRADGTIREKLKKSLDDGARYFSSV